ncbi:MAG TPA: hypothetical protein VFE05_00600 [Longimicrobiaceae bacterium]|jgi:hypothetical protein|nr:hypothetical protein [Longimicrobiaceae bacterium]
MSTEMQTTVAEVTENAALIAQQRALNEMLARSATDAQFRALMLNDAHAAFAAAGVEVAAELDIVFIENKADVTIVLPEALDEMMELSESELLQVNGGATPAAASVASAMLSSLECFVVSAVVSGSFALTAYVIAKAVD